MAPWPSAIRRRGLRRRGARRRRAVCGPVCAPSCRRARHGRGRRAPERRPACRSARARRCNISAPHRNRRRRPAPGGRGGAIPTSWTICARRPLRRPRKRSLLRRRSNLTSQREIQGAQNASSAPLLLSGDAGFRHATRRGEHPGQSGSGSRRTSRQRHASASKTASLPIRFRPAPVMIFNASSAMAPPMIPHSGPTTPTNEQGSALSGAAFTRHR